MDKPLLLMLIMAMVMEYVCAQSQYHGPYGYYFTPAQCGKIVKLTDKNVEQCEDLCDTLSKCTAFNYHRKTYSCTLWSCGSPQPMPIGDTLGLSEWEGWSKEHIKRDNSTLPQPNPSGRQIFTQSPTYRHREFYTYLDRHYSDRQCPVVGLWYNHQIPWDKDCKYLCNDTPKCTAFNEKVDEGCVLRACGDPPPYPIGVSDTKSNTWWSSRTVSKVEFGYTRYHGPYAKYFNYKQCRMIKEYKHKSHVECEELCDATPGCTAFNFKQNDWSCQMRSCGSPQPIPIGDEYRHRFYVGFSKEPITPNQKKEPFPVCPSMWCEKWEYPIWMRRMNGQGVGQRQSKREYCKNEKCNKDPFLWNECPHCGGWKNHQNWCKHNDC